MSELSENNKLKNETVIAYNKRQLDVTEKYLRILLNNTQEEQEINGNLALVLFKQKKYVEAKKVYKSLQNSNNIQVAVESELHLGLLSCIEKDTLMAITHFENALKKDSKNELSRFNLELLKKSYAGIKKGKTNSQDKVIVEKTKQNKTDLDPLSEREELLARLKKINISESQAKILFEAISKNEAKYIQQKKRKITNNEIEQNW